MNRINKISIPTILEKKQSIVPMENQDFLSSFPEYCFKLAEAVDAWPWALRTGPAPSPLQPAHAPQACSADSLTLPLENRIHVNGTPGLLHNCGWRYFSLGSLNKDSRDKFLLKFSSRKCLVSADVYMLPVVSTWKRYNSVLFFSLTGARRKSQIKNMTQTYWALTNGST